MSDVEITCKPGDGILAVSADQIAALDLLGLTMPPGRRWTITVHIDDPFYHDGVLLLATPAWATEDADA